MTTGFAAFLFFCYWVITVLGWIFDGIAIDTGPANALVQFSIFRQLEVDLLVLNFKFPAPNLEWFTSLGNILIWNVSIWQGWANFVRIPLLLSLSFGVVGALLIAMFSAALARFPRGV